MTDKIYAKNPDFVAREVADEFILVPIRKNLKSSDSLYVLNSTGATFWRSLDGRQSLSQVTRNMLDQFDVSRDLLEKDLKVLLEDLLTIEAISEVR